MLYCYIPDKNIKYVYTIYQQTIYQYIKDLFRNVYWQKQIQKDLQSVKTELQYVDIFGNAPQYDMMFKMKRH